MHRALSTTAINWSFNVEKINIYIVAGGKMPEYKHSDDACADCYARLPTDYVTILPGARVVIPLGFAIELPEGYEAVIRPRSSLSLEGLDATIGTIDAGYRGEVSACMINNTGSERKVYNLDRICQMKIQKADQFEFVKAEKLSETERGIAGFGSTGI